MKKQIMVACGLAALMLATSGAQAAKMIQVKGSDTMVNLGQAWAESFIKKTRIPVAVLGGGSGTGIAALIGGKTDIAECSRPMKDEEIEKAKKNGVTPHEVVVAWDGISVIVNPKNPVKQLTVKQLADIYTGKITNWKEVGGKDGKIVLLAREISSGTHVFFKEHIIQSAYKNGEYAQSTLMLPTTQAIHDEVAASVNAIGYIGLGYVTKKVHSLPISQGDGKPYVTPSVKTVKDKTYPVSRPLLWYTNGKPKGEVKKFVDFALSAQGQKIVAQLDFVPVK